MYNAYLSYLSLLFGLFRRRQQVLPLAALICLERSQIRIQLVYDALYVAHLNIVLSDVAEEQRGVLFDGRSEDTSASGADSRTP